MDWKDIDALENHVMDAAQGNTASLMALSGALAEVPPESAESWPLHIRQEWDTALELLLDELDRTALTDLQLDFLRNAMRTGLDSTALRDFLTAAARRQFADYLDPAGMIAAIGVLERGLTMKTVWRRWCIFSELREGLICCHSAHGKGTIREIDGFANELNITFERPQSLPLGMAMESVVFVRSGSVVDKLLRGSLKVTSLAGQLDTEDQLLASLLSSEDNAGAFLPTLLGNDYAKLTAQAASKSASKSAAGTGAASDRDWDEARSLAELVELLRKTKSIAVSDTSPDAARALLSPSADREDYAEQFCEAVTRIWIQCPDTAWLHGILADLAPNVVTWQDDELFVRVTDRMPGRLTPSWLIATVQTLGAERLASLTLGLPLRLWGSVEKALAPVPDGAEVLLHTVLDAVGQGDVSADPAVWLWKSKRPERQILADPNLLFRILARTVSGSHIRAAKDLRRLVMETDDFQRFALRNGDPAAVTAMVNCARHLTVLSSGERQSLLVRIVRLFPKAKPLVEQKQKVIATKALARLTSMRSYEVRRRELQEIINVKIPENSRAIAHARSYGDLRENAEYKAAKEEQAYLGARRAELEEDLAEVMSTDFGDVHIDGTVVPGCTVSLEYPEGERREFHVLGLWDSDPSKSMISYDTPLGQILVGTRVGDQATVPSGDVVTVAEVSALTEELQHWIRGDDLA